MKISDVHIGLSRDEYLLLVWLLGISVGIMSERKEDTDYAFKLAQKILQAG